MSCSLNASSTSYVWAQRPWIVLPNEALAIVIICTNSEAILLSSDPRQQTGLSRLVMSKSNALGRKELIAGARCCFFKKFDPAIQRPPKRDFFIFNQLNHVLRIFLQFRKRPAHRIDDDRHKFVKEWLRQPKLLATEADARRRILRSTYPRPSLLGTAPSVRAKVRHRDVIGDHAEGDVVSKLLIGGFGCGSAALVWGNFRCISDLRFARSRRTTASTDRCRNCRCLSCRTWQMRSRPMPVSTCWAGSGVSLPVGVAVVLDEDEVPDFHDAGVCRR